MVGIGLLAVCNNMYSRRYHEFAATLVSWAEEVSLDYCHH